jgi:hypothetical protein
MIERSADGHWRFHYAGPNGYEVKAPVGVPGDVVGWIGGFLDSEIGPYHDVDAWLALRWQELRDGIDNGIGGNGLFLWLEGDEVVVYSAGVDERALCRLRAEVMDQVVDDFCHYRSGAIERLPSGPAPSRRGATLRRRWAASRRRRRGG